MPSSLSNNQRGMLAIVGCMASYTVNDVLVKQILRTYPVGEVIFVRGVIAMLLIGAVALALGHRTEIGAAVKPAARRALGVRRALHRGLHHRARAYAARQCRGRAADRSAADHGRCRSCCFGEAVGWRRWTAIGVGFVGALLVIKPMPSAFDVWALIGAASALAAALREISNRRIGRGVPAMVIAFWGAVGITLFGTVFAVTEDWRMFERGDLAQLSSPRCSSASRSICMALRLPRRRPLGGRAVPLQLPDHLGGRRLSGVRASCPTAGRWSARC